VSGQQSVNRLARVVAVYEKEVTPQGQETKTILSGILGDATATVPFTAWEPLPMPLAKGDVIRVQNAYTKEYRGQVQVNFGVRTAVGKEAPDALPEFKSGPGPPYVGKPTPVRVVDLRAVAPHLAERGGAADVTVRGILIDLREGSGLVYRCPECRRVLRKGACRLHGEVKGEPDLRVKAVLDDGSGAVTAVFDRELTEALLDKTLDACIAAAKEAMSTDIVRDELADVLVAQPIEVRGNVTSDDYGLMMIVESAKMLKVDVQAEAREMLEGLEGPA